MSSSRAGVTGPGASATAGAQGSASDELRSAARFGGYAAIAGAASMIFGAVLWRASGTDLDRALADGDMAGYLDAAAGNGGILTANLSAWIVGVLLIGLAGATFARLSGRRSAAADAGALSVVAMFADGLSTYGSLIVPVGPGWTTAAGVVSLRRAR